MKIEIELYWEAPHRNMKYEYIHHGWGWVFTAWAGKAYDDYKRPVPNAVMAGFRLFGMYFNLQIGKYSHYGLFALLPEDKQKP